MYEFKVPGDSSSHVVMWDYNIGIVRLASLFRLCGFNKVCLLESTILPETDGK